MYCKKKTIEDLYNLKDILLKNKQTKRRKNIMNKEYKEVIEHNLDNLESVTLIQNNTEDKYKLIEPERSLNLISIIANEESISNPISYDQKKYNFEIFERITKKVLVDWFNFSFDELYAEYIEKMTNVINDEETVILQYLLLLKANNEIDYKMLQLIDEDEDNELPSLDDIEIR